MGLFSHLLISLIFALGALGQSSLLSTWPNYEGAPDSPFDPEWQSFFKVDSSRITNVSFELPTSYAGNLPVDRPGHPNDTLFFWAFEKEPGSLNNSDSDLPYVIYLQGGPGVSTMISVVLEGGPIGINNDGSTSPNPYSWSNLTDVLFIDNPVGVGYSTADSEGYAYDENMVATDFLGFLVNLVKVFPALQSRPLVLSGESYAGFYVSYIAKALLSSDSPPVRLGAISTGNAQWNSDVVSTEIPAINFLKTYPALIAYNVSAYREFEMKSQFCNYSIDLTYPQYEPLPNIIAPGPSDLASPYCYPGGDIDYLMASERKSFAKREFQNTHKNRRLQYSGPQKRQQSTDSVLNPWYGCELFEEIWDNAANYTFPWNLNVSTAWWGANNVYDMPDATYPKTNTDPAGSLSVIGTLFNDPNTISALHAPNFTFYTDLYYTFGGPEGVDPSPPPMIFLSELIQNATERNISTYFLSGNRDSLLPHLGTEITIQNTTWKGVRGFSRKPATAWYTDSGILGGVVHQERGLTYGLFVNATHLIPQSQPEAAYVFLRDFILGNSETGLVEVLADGTEYVVGGETYALPEDVYPIGNTVIYGNGASPTTFTYPVETIAAWYEAVIECSYDSMTDGCRATPLPQ